MVNDLINLDKLFKELEWLSSESRQILLSRMAIRTLPFLFEFASKTKNEFFGPERLSRCILDIFRIVISVTSNAHDKTSLTVQAPIVPALTPSHVSLKFKGNDSVLFRFEHARSQEFYIGYSDYELGYNGNPIVALVSGADQKISLEETIRVFFEETKVVYQNLTLSDRTISKGSARSIANLPLWTFAENKIQEVAFHDFLKPIENYIGADLQFWSNWLAGLQSGDQLPFELQKRVAQIPDKIWEAGVEAVAGAIEEIEAEFAAERLAQAEDIDRNPETGKYVVEPTVQDPDALVDRIFNQLDFSLDLALRGHNSSGFSELCVSYKYLAHTRDNCRDDPNAVHMHLRLAREIIEEKLRDDTYRAEDGLNALVVAIERHEVQLRADHPAVRDAHDRFVEQRLRDMDDEKRLILAEEFRGLRENSEDRLEQEFGLDAETLETDSGVAAQKDAVKRSGGRSQKMAIIEKAGNAVKSVDGSASWKLTGIGMRLSKIAEILGQLL